MRKAFFAAAFSNSVSLPKNLQSKRKNQLGLVSKNATFIHKFRQAVIQALSLVLIVSTLSVISVVAPPSAKALSNADCTPTVSGLTVSAVASGNDCILTFTAGTGTWTTPAGISTISIVVVGGGGGGGGDGGSGGGGGELRANASQSVTGSTSASITIGQGGAGGSWLSSTGGQGGTATTISGALSFIANGGGGGAGWTSTTGGAGGSGGTGGTGSNGGAGGGGPGNCPVNGNLYFGANGSNGPSTTATSSTATNYGGGGGGGLGANTYNAGTATRGTAGGAGGGGRGSNYKFGVGDSTSGVNGASAGQAGTANTGGGGGGGSACDAHQAMAAGIDGYTQRTAGGAGGSGVVIVKFTVATISTPSTPDLDAASDSGVSSTDNTTNDTTPTFSGTATAGSTIQLQRDGVNTGSTCLTNSSGNWQCTTATLGHSGGGNNYRVVSTYFGQTATSGTLNVVIRTSGPGTMSVSRSDGASTALSTGQTLTIRFGAGTNVTGFELADVTITGGTLSNFTTISGRDYSATFTPTANTVGSASISVGANTFSDLAGFSNTAGSALTISYNTLADCSPSETISGGYTYLAFKSVSSCNYSPPANVPAIDLLVVAGGGGGASRHAGGGGAGGLINATSVTTDGSAFLITVGAGGAGGPAQGTGGANASNGGSSAISGGGITTRTAVGGGGGGYGNSAGAAGGSGGGGGNGGAGGSPTAGQGNSGSAGLSDNSSFWVGGGGGGAGGAGTTSSSTKAGSGGAGLEISWIPTAVGATLGVGTSGTTWRVFAGGGGGGTDRSASAGGNAGTGGGGAGATWTATPSAGTANSGGGGGGSGISGVASGSLKGGDGGSGVVVIRYANTYTITYNYNSADGGNSTVTSSFTTGGTVITLPVPTRTGFTFAGWFEALDLSGSALGLTYSPTQSRTIYAKWNSINADLSALVISQGTLTPSFAAATTSYTASVANAITSMTVTPTRSDSGATITVNGTAVTSGSASGSISLSVGSNTITVVVTAASGTTKSYTITVTRAASAVAPTIGTQPVSLARTVGQSATFTVAATASDSGDLTYQWQKGGVNIANATSATYTFTTSATSDAGDYRVVVTNTKNSTTATTTSSVAKLAVAGTNNHRNFARTSPTNVLSSGRSFTSSGAVIPATGSFTLEGWFRENALLDNQNPIFAQGTVNVPGFGLMIASISGRKLQFFSDSGTLTSSTVIAQGKWYHYAVTFDSSSRALKLFLNGTEIGSISNATPNLTGDFYLGRNNYYTNHFFHGQQDQFKVWTSALTASEIATSMHSYGEGGITGKTLRTLYDFNQSSGDTMNDVLGSFNLSDFNGGGMNTWASSALNVTFDEQGGSTVTDTTVDFYNRIADPGNPTRSGYTFTGWSTTSNGSVITFPYIFTPLEAVPLYAIWSANSNTVTFNANDGSGSPATTTQTITSGTATALTANSFTRTGYTFAGWDAAADGSGTDYTNQQSVTITASMTLFAKWTANSNTFAYNGNSSTGGTTPTGGGSKSFGSTITVAANTFTRSGYTFNNWNTAADGSGTTYAGTGLVTFTMPDAAVTLYAQWTLNTYAITFKSGASGSGTDQILSKTHGTTFTIPNSSTANSYFTRAGYTVSGWSGTDGGTQTYAFGASYTNESATILYPVWSAATNTVVFDVNSDSSVSNGSFVTGGQLTKPTNPTKTKKIFGGWSTSETADQGDIANLIRTWPYSPAATSNITLYAIWHDDYSLTLAGTAGTSARKIGTSVSPIEIVPKDRSYTWEAWINPTGHAGTGPTKWATIMDNADDGNNYGRSWLYFMNDATGYYISAGYYGTNQNGSNTVSPAGSVRLNAWQHIAVSMERTGAAQGSCSSSGTLVVRIYIDGILSATNTVNSFSGCLNSLGLMVGDNFDDANQQFKGQIDQVKIWDGVLTLAEIEASRNNFFVGNVDNTLRAHYGFNELSSSPALNNVVKNLASEADTYDLTLFGTSSSNVTSNISRTQNSYQISYNGNTSTTGSVSTQTGLIPYESVTVSSEGNLAKTGYTFSSWNTLANGSGTSVSPGTSLTSLYGDTTLYAIWTANSNTVTFNANDGSGSPATTTQSITSGTATALTANSFTRTGYTFAGWDAAADGSGTDYTNQQSVTITAGMTLYAKWTANSNTLIFNNNSGSGTMTNQTITTGTATAISTNTFTKSGYTFAGWNTQANGSGTSYSDGQSITISAGATLYAQWIAAANTITFNNNTGSGTMANQSITSGTATALTSNTFTKTGHTFAGWNTLAGGGGTSYTNGQSVTVTSSATLYAQWTANSNTFAYSGNSSSGGSTPTGGGTKSFGSTITVAANTFTRTGYTFANWNTAADGSGTTYAGTGSVTFTMPDAAVTLYAQWSIVLCTPTTSISGGFKVFTFTNTSACFWNVPSDASAVDVLVVGGGGGGAGNKTPRTFDGAGAGGGGGAYLANSVSISGAVEIAAGAGGAGGTTTSTGSGATGSQGSRSYFATITAGGGGGGGCDNTAGLNLACNTAAMSGATGTAGGGGGGASNYYNAYSFGNGGTGSNVTIGGTTYSAQNGFRGGYYNDGGTSAESTAGPGGGARSAANRNTPGSGLVSSFTGTSAEYGKGGSAYGVASWTFRSTTFGYGTGGDGAYHASAATNGAAGANGVVIVRYAIPSITYLAGTSGTGSAPTTPTAVDFGATFTTPANTFTRSGYTFAGWSDGTNTYAAGVTYPTSGSVNANVTLTATWTLSCAGGGVCIVGDTGPGGGIVFYVEPNNGTFACGQSLSSLCKYLEAAPITGASAWTDARYAWSGNVNTAIGTTSTAIGSGYSNTLKMVTQIGAGTSGAGSATRNYRGGGLNDWYLPSKDELNQLYINRTVASASDGYWSSSEYNATGAWDQGFGNGSQGVADPGKQQTTPVRPIRAFGSSAVESAIIYVPAIAGVTAPVSGATPVTTVTAANGYTGTVSWSGSPSTFAAATTYTATITLTAASGFTLTGVTANFFTVSGATSVTHLANSGSITAVFPATAASPALTPAFGSTTATADGFTVQISNYSSDYTWGGSATASGSVAINGSGLVTVTGVAPGTSSTATITTTRTSYTGGSATVSATSISSNVATLSALTLTTATLSPTFASGTTSYTASVANATTSITVTPTRTQANATITVNGTAVTSGSASGSISLNVGANTITVVVTAQDGTTTSTYTVTVTRAVGAASKVAVTRASVGTERGAAFTTQPQITVQDSGSNTVTSSSALVTATVSSGGTLVGTTTATASSGVATFTGLGVNGNIGTTYTITYTVSGLTVATATVTLTGTTCDGSFTCQKGDTGPGGGIIFYVAPSFFTQVGASGSMCTTNCKYLEAAPGTWSGGSSDPTITWATGSNQSVAVEGADGTAIGTGYQNSVDIANQSGNVAASSAAVAAREYTTTVSSITYSDWFLPSHIEMQELCDWQTAGRCRSPSNTLSMNTGIGATGFVAGSPYYWKSSEVNASNAQHETMAQGGGQGSSELKSTAKRVRPIRAFGPAPIVISVAAIAGVTAPLSGATPVTTTTAGTGYTGTVSWSGSPTTFAPGTTYTATITLTAAAGYTVTGVSENFFTVSGATTRTNPADSGVITATFPATALETYTITLAAGTNGSGSNQTLTKTNGTNLTLPDSANANGYFTRAGYTVSGWSTSNGGSQTHALGGSFTTEAATTLYPVWTVISCAPTLTTTGGYTRYTFTTTGTCTWTVPNGITSVEVLAVAGGGGGGWAWGNAGAGGGGGGQVKTAQATLGSTLEVTVGAGGSVGSLSSGRGGTGGNSSVSTITALGGTGGCGRTTPTCSVASMATASAAANGGRAGAASGESGAAGGGSNTTLPLGGTRGEGTSSDYSGSAVTYGYGGAGGYPNSGVSGGSGGSNTGNGGGGGSSTAGTESQGEFGGAGGSGLVVIRIANTNTVTFNANDGSGSPATATQSITTGVSTALNSNTFTRTGYTFNGWNLNSAGTAGNYSNGQSVTITASVTLFAKWAAVTTNAITYDNQGATTAQSGGSTTYTTAAAISTIPTTAPLRTGYTFSGWFTATTGGTQVTNGSYTPPSPFGSITLYARWSAITNNAITYDNQGATTSQSGGSTTYTTAAAVATIPTTAPLRTGFTFSGWFTASTGGTQVTNGSYTPASPYGSITLYAQWSGISNSFIFNNNTGSGTMANQTIVSGTATALSANSFTKTGYTFAGWNTLANGGGTSYTDGQSITITAGTTLYAQWTAAANTFIFDANTGSGTMVNQSIASGTSTALTTNSFTKTGYTFAGWNTLANGGGTSYTDGQSITITAGTTLYAQWTIISSAFAYNGNTSDGGSAPSGGGDKDYGTTITVAANSYTKTGHTFSGWNTAANGSGTSYAGTGLITFAMPDAAVTLYAQWTANTNSLTYNGNTNTGGSTPSGGGSKSFGTTITVAANTFTKTGYTFTAWNTAANGSGTSYDGTGSITFVMPDASVTLYAQWSANTLVVTFNAQGGTTVTAGSTFTAGSIAAAPTAPTKSNYTFTGWATSVGGSAIEFEYTHGQTADFTLYALWAANVYTVTYVYNSATGGNSAVSDTFTTGGTAITLPTPTRTGYTFAGWHSDSLFATSIGLAGASYSPTGSALSLSAYAKWTAIDYTVTYSAATKTSGAVPVDSANYIYATNVLIKGNTGSLVRTGYTFLGWTSAADGSSTLLTSGSTFSTPAANMTFYAKWSANTYTVTYNKNGASGSPATATDSYTTGGTAVTLTAVGTMVKTGFNFAGWSATPTGSVITGTYTTAVDTTLYAIWTIKSISISFAKGSAINESFFNFPTNRSADYGTLITLSDTVDSAIDIGGVSHAFMGWNDGNSVYQSGATYLLGETAPTFTAVWVKIFAVRYGFNGGTAAVGSSAIDVECSQGSNTCTDGQVITSNAAPSKTGYDFAGWVDQNNQSVPTAGTFTVSATRYLIYATWTPINYAITYNAGGGATTPASFTKQISQSFSTADAITRVGYTFNGWSDGTSVYGAGATYYVASSPVTLTAQWVANIYTVSYDWNGGSGSSTADASYTVGTTAITLPLVGDHVKDGYNFAGWSTSTSGDLISGGYAPTANTTLYAIWGTGSYTVTYDYNWGSVSNTSASVLNGNALTLPTPTRLNFVFDGWYTARTSGSKVGNAGTSHQPTGSKTLYARWIQSSLFGIDPASLLRLGQTTARDAAQATFIGENATSAVSVTVPAGSLPDGTIVYFDLVGDFTRARTLLSADNSYIISMVVSWLAPDETVPDTNAGKAISLTIENDSIKAGASIYAIVAGQATLLTTATQNGIVTVALTSDPEVVVIATKPNAPASVVASSNGVRQSVVSWSAPASDGGSAIIGYTVTSSNNQTCTTATTSCAVTGLSDATAYTFTVVATNGVGTSVASSSASATTAGVPGAPTSVTASSGASKQSVIAWAAPTSNGGSSITAYTATSNTGATCSTSSTTCTITGLSDGTTYTFTVTATNVIGISNASTSASARTADVVVPPAPVDNIYAGQVSASPAPSMPAPAPSMPAPAPTPVVVVGNSDVKIPTVEVKPTEPVVTPPPAPSVEVKPTEPVVKPTTVKVDSASQKFISEVKIVDGKVVLTPVVGFSGKKNVTVTINENGLERIVQIALTVLPEVVTTPIVTPIGMTKTTIKWAESPNATSYTVYLDRKKVCSTSGKTCTVNKILGPKALVEIISSGGDRTISQRVRADLKVTAPILVGQLVSTTNTKSTLTPVDISTLNKIVTAIKSQGFKTVMISEITTTKRTQAAAEARMAAIKKYIRDKTGISSLKFEEIPVTSRTYINKIMLKA